MDKQTNKNKQKNIYIYIYTVNLEKNACVQISLCSRPTLSHELNTHALFFSLKCFVFKYFTENKIHKNIHSTGTAYTQALLDGD